MPVKVHNAKKPSAIDLFCGAGGFSEGLLRAGFDILCACDSWDKAVESYKLNFSHQCLQADIANMTWWDLRSHVDIDEREIDLVVGGPPCQGFSIQRIGPDCDSRNSLIMEFARLIKEIKPRMFLMENVPGLLGKRGKPLLEKFFQYLTAVGFEAEAHIVNAADYGVPQVRKRVFIAGWRRRDVHPFVLPPPTHISCHQTVWDAVGDLPSPKRPGEPLSDPLHKRMRLSVLNQERLKHIPPGGGMEHLPVHLRVNCHRNGADRIGHRYVYGRLAPDRPAATITARFDSFTRGRFAHPYEDRNITLREGARLQTFKDSFRFIGSQEDIAALIGNAVPPTLAEILGRAINRHLAGECDELSHRLNKPRPRVCTRAQIGLFDNEELQA